MAAIFRAASLTNQGDRDLLARHPELLELAPAPPDAVSMVATRAGRVVGFARAAETAGRGTELTDVFVDPDHMRSGVGSALLEAVAVVVAARGRRHIDVDANIHALDFYRRLGFEALRRADPRHGAAVRMRRLLRPDDTA